MIKYKNTNLLIGLSGMTLLFSFGLARSNPTSTTQEQIVKPGGQIKNQLPDKPEEALAREQRNRQYQLGLKAYREGDLQTARLVFEKLEEKSYPNLLLARIYVKLGEEKKAYQQLHAFFNPPVGFYSSEQKNPRNLLYYGDLCSKLGHKEESDKAYLYACKAAATTCNHPVPIGALLLSVAPDASHKVLRSAALAAASTWFRNDKEQANLEAAEAVALDPQSILARLAYAITFATGRPIDLDNANQQAWKARQLASDDLLPAIDNFCWHFHLLEDNTSVTSANRRENHYDLYHHTGTVPTPKSPPDLKVSLPEE